MEDVIDNAAGIVLVKKVGDKAKKGDVLAYAHTNKEGIDDVIGDIHDAFLYTDAPVKVAPIIHEYIHK